MKKGKQRIYSLIDFFTCMMDQFGQVIIVDLLYSIPVLIFGGIMFGLSFVTTLNIFIVFLLIPLLSPFTAGLFYCAGRVTLKEKLSAVRDFKKGMKTEKTKYDRISQNVRNYGLRNF